MKAQQLSRRRNTTINLWFKYTSKYDLNVHGQHSMLVVGLLRN